MRRGRETTSEVDCSLLDRKVDLFCAGCGGTLRWVATKFRL